MQTISKKVEQREKIIDVLYRDFISQYNIKTSSVTNNSLIVTNKGKFDRLDLKTTNSLFGLNVANVQYRVVQSGMKNYLIRCEMLKDGVNIQQDKDFYTNVIVEDIEYFKLSSANGVFEVLIRAKDMKDIYFKFGGIW
jgi:hypothetical protein